MYRLLALLIGLILFIFILLALLTLFELSVEVQRSGGLDPILLFVRLIEPSILSRVRVF